MHLIPDEFTFDPYMLACYYVCIYMCIYSCVQINLITERPAPCVNALDIFTLPHRQNTFIANFILEC